MSRPLLAALLAGSSLFATACGETRVAGSDVDGGDGHQPTHDGGGARDSGNTGDAGASHDSGSAPDGSCRSNADCDADTQVCVGAYGPGCVCYSATGCTVDSQCDAGEVCRNGADLLGACATDSGLACAKPCTAASDCFYWQECLPNGHCQALPCDKCPSYLSCPASGCEAKDCSTDGDCPGGYCVGGTCLGRLGTCQPDCA